MPLINCKIHLDSFSILSSARDSGKYKIIDAELHVTE